MSPGEVVLFRFPQTNQSEGKLRPALLLSQMPGPFPDWLVCMISSQQRHFIPEFDELVDVSEADFVSSGLKLVSVIRVARLAVVEESMLVGSIGKISDERLTRIKLRLSDWVKSG